MTDNFLECEFYMIPIMKAKKLYVPGSIVMATINNLPVHKLSGGNHTSDNTYILDLPEFKQMKEWFEKQLNSYVHDVLCINKKVHVYITQSWIVFNPKGTYHSYHLHGNSLISGIYYLQGDVTPVRFIREVKDGVFGLIILPFDKLNKYNISELRSENTKHSLTLFPSNVLHSVGENENDETRISLSFNTFFSGSIGEDKSLTRLDLKEED